MSVVISEIFRGSPGTEREMGEGGKGEWDGGMGEEEQRAGMAEEGEGEATFGFPSTRGWICNRRHSVVLLVGLGGFRIALL